MIFKYKYIEFEQPLGLFLFTVVPANELLKFYTIDHREYIGNKADGTQRVLNEDRIKEIADYCSTMDAAFPTSMIIALNKGDYLLNEKDKTIEIKNKAEIIDGQHRIEGLRKAASIHGIDVVSQFNLPCVFIIEPIPEQKAFVFATINGKQTKVNKSLVFDLFGISESEDPYNILHTLARTLNFSKNSPFYRRLKMLGKKSNDVNSESLTQGTFVDVLLDKISKDALLDRDKIRTGKIKEIEKNPKLVLQDYMLNDKVNLLVPLFVNIFDAVKDNWPNEWEDHEAYILTKTTGYIGIMKGIDSFIIYGKTNGVLTKSYFKFIFEKAKKKLVASNLKLVSDDFPPGGKGENKLKGILVEVYNENFPIETELLAKLKKDIY